MKIQKTPLRLAAVHVLLAIVIGFITLATSNVSRAALFGPYTNDVYTLHLWHFDDINGSPLNAPTNAANFDAVTDNPITSPIVMSNTPGPVNQSGFAGYPPTDFALQGQPPFTNSVAPLINFGYSVETFTHSTLYPSYVQLNPLTDGATYTCPTNLSDYINTNTGAFTFEALVNPAFNPVTDTGTREILCGDSGFAVRAWQFRFNAGRLEFNSIANGGTHQVFAPLPKTGPDAASAGNWYHVAVTYTGDSPTNGDTAKQFRFYWTLLDVTRTNADMLLMTNLTYGITNTAHAVPGIGGNARNSPIDKVGVSDSYIGFIDEVRDSSVCRKSTEMIFDTNQFIAPPIAAIPTSETNNLVGYGQTLAIVASETGTTPITNQWYQDGIALPGQTNTVLTINNVTFAANGNYQLFATNSAGSTNSVIASVTVGAAFNGLFDSGVDANGNPLYLTAPGSVDLHYLLTQSADPATINSNAIVWSSTPNGAIGNGPLAGWIGSKNNGGGGTGTYSYQTLFQVNNGDVASATLSGLIWACGPHGGDTVQAFLNGVETDITMAANPVLSLTPFVITNGLQPGSNTLVFTMNANGGGSPPGAIRVQMIGIGNALPPGLPVINNPPTDQTVPYGATVVLPVVALGRPPLSYQWYSNDVAISPATISSATAQYLTFAGTNFDPSELDGSGNFTANYKVVVSNDSGSVTSSVAALTISVPALTIVSAGEPIWNPANSKTNVVVIFSQPVNPTTAGSVGNYALDNGASVVSATLVAPNEVVLGTSVLNPATSYTLTVSNVKSLIGITMSPSPASVSVGIYPAAMALWIRADTGVTSDANGVSQWNDLSGNGNNLFNTAGAPFEPQLVPSAINGRPVIRFSGTNGTFMQASDSPSLEITGDMTIVAVVNFATLAWNTNGMIVSKVSANQPAPYDYYANSTAVMLYRGNGTLNKAVASAKLPSTGVPHVLDVTMQGTNVTHRLDGLANGNGILSTPIADTGQPLSIGTRGDFVNRLTGDLAELIVFGSAISPSDAAALENYLGAEYNLQVGVNTSPTNIVFSASGNQLTFSWPADHIGWELQSNSVGLTATGSWFTVPGSTTTNQVTFTTDQSKASVFFRMVYP